MSEHVDTQSVSYTGVYKRRDKYGFRANVPGGRGKQMRSKPIYSSADQAFRARVEYLGGTAPQATGGMSLEEWLRRWLLVCEETLAEDTIPGYRHSIEKHLIPRLGHLTLAEVTEEAIREALRDMVAYGYSTNSIAFAFRRLKTALRAAKREGYIPRCAADNVTPPKGKPPKRRTVWTNADAQKFSKYVLSLRDSAMWLTFLATGARRKEIRRLEWPSVNLDAGEATIVDAKTKAGIRTIPLSPRLVEVLRTWRASQAAFRLAQGEQWRGGDHVFTTERGRPYSAGAHGDRLERLCEKAGVPRLSPHEIRHTFGTLSLVNGIDIKIVSEIMGHANTNITRDLYQQVPGDLAHKAIDTLTDRMFG